MEILKDLTDSQVRKLAAQPTPKPQAGTWTLTAPDGRTWQAEGPLQCVSAEINDRVPPLVALARIRRGLIERKPSKPLPTPARRQRDDR